MKHKGIIVIDKATQFVEMGKVLYMDNIFKINEIMKSKCLIENDNFGRLTVLKDKLEQLYIIEDNTKEKFYIDFDEYEKIKKK